MAWHDAPYAKRVAIYATAQQQRARPESAHSGRAFYRSNRQRKPWLPQAERKKECNLPVWVELVAKPAEPESLRRIPFQTNRPVRGIPSNRHQYISNLHLPSFNKTGTQLYSPVYLQFAEKRTT